MFCFLQGVFQIEFGKVCWSDTSQNSGQVSIVAREKLNDVVVVLESLLNELIQNE